MNFYISMQDLGRDNWRTAYENCQNYNICDNLKSSLPTKEQLVIIYNNKTSLNNQLSISNFGKLSEGRYWSSSTNWGSSVYFVDMSNGGISSFGEGNPAYYRPILIP